MKDQITVKMTKKNQTIINCKQKVKIVTLFNFIDLFIDEMKYNRAYSTILQYKNTLRLLSNYAKQVKGLDFQDINMSFYTDFQKYMFKSGYSDTYFGNQIKFIRLFMNEAFERGYTDYAGYKNRKFISPQTPTTKIYLTHEEIHRLRLLQLSDHENLERSRDLFIIACKTGLRFSDLVRLAPSNFSEEEKILYVQTQKTKKLVCIPLSSEVLTLCRKYQFKLPRMSNVTFNTHIREIGKMAGISKPVELITVRGHCSSRRQVLKYELMTSHTARRSFATNAFLAKVPNISIMKITGHSTEQAFMKYIRISEEDNARNLLSHPYFS